MVVLFQTGKGADMGAAFGGGSSQTLFGSSGAATFLSKLTTVAAIVFMITSLALAYLSSNRTSSSIVGETPAAVEEQAAPSESAPAPTEGSAPQESAPATEAAPETQPSDN
jgi:preprotein translocase subunit SecG